MPPPRLPAEPAGVGDGRTFEQALRALDKLIAERSRDVPDPYSPIRLAYERIIRGDAPQATLGVS
jgi:hypothetical protein